MPRSHVFGEYIGRESVYALFDRKRCIYVGETKNGRAGVAGRVREHLRNAAQAKRVGKLHEEINRSDKPQDWYLQWRLELYTVAECAKMTGRPIGTVKEAQQAMIELLKPERNVQRR